MIYVTKAPKQIIPEFIVYKVTCDYCKCEFYVDDDSIYGRIRDMDNEIVGYCDCPYDYKKVPVYRKNIKIFDSKEDFEKYYNSLNIELI